jgi:hypothetical protein
LTIRTSCPDKGFDVFADGAVKARVMMAGRVAVKIFFINRWMKERQKALIRSGR